MLVAYTVCEIFWNTSKQKKKMLNCLCDMENVCLKTVVLVSHRSNGENKLPVHLELDANLRVISYHNPLLGDKIRCVRGWIYCH